MLLPTVRDCPMSGQVAGWCASQCDLAALRHFQVCPRTRTASAVQRVVCLVSWSLRRCSRVLARRRGVGIAIPIRRLPRRGGGSCGLAFETSGAPQLHLSQHRRLVEGLLVRRQPSRWCTAAARHASGIEDVPELVQSVRRPPTDSQAVRRGPCRRCGHCRRCGRTGAAIIYARQQISMTTAGFCADRCGSYSAFGDTDYRSGSTNLSISPQHGQWLGRRPCPAT
jgi:hypothetical protein